MCKRSYPANWRKVSLTLRRVIPYCERCGATEALTVHHRGAPYPDGRPGSKADKRDLRRENLMVLCETCHRQADYWRCLRHYHKHLAAQRRKARHDRLGIGTGLVLC